jgi:GntR family transcriptional regulator/MocR family aminotransferase
MTRTGDTAGRAILHVTLDRRATISLSHQIYDSIVAAIADRRLPAAAPLPSTRALALDLGVARSTVVAAFNQLREDGFVENARGRVARISPRSPRPAETGQPAARSRDQRPFRPSHRAGRVDGFPGDLASIFAGHTPRPFRSGIPALDLFPVDLWARLLARAWKRSPPRSLGYGDPQGHLPLRRAIARYLRSARGVNCSEEQIVVCSGSQQAIDLAARVLLDEGDAAWVEDPGYLVAQAALRTNGVTLVPVPVDSQGLDVRAGIRRAPDAKLAYVTPARQVPLGVVMSVARRRALLSWAAGSGAWIFEDDYDSDIQFASRPQLPLYARDSRGCVLLAGTFSKILFPALRLGYIVAPVPVAQTIAKMKHLTDIASPYLPQAVLADFIDQGHFERHIRKMRAVYRRRQELLVRLLRKTLGRSIDVSRADAGMNLVLWLPREIDDVAVANAGRAVNLDLIPLSRLYLEHDPSPRPGLLLGFGGIREDDLIGGVSKLKSLVRGV